MTTSAHPAFTGFVFFLAVLVDALRPFLAVLTAFFFGARALRPLGVAPLAGTFFLAGAFLAVRFAFGTDACCSPFPILVAFDTGSV